MFSKARTVGSNVMKIHKTASTKTTFKDGFRCLKNRDKHAEMTMFRTSKTTIAEENMKKKKILMDRRMKVRQWVSMCGTWNTSKKYHWRNYMFIHREENFQKKFISSNEISFFQFLHNMIRETPIYIPMRGISWIRWDAISAAC